MEAKSDGIYHAYRCQSCQRLITKLQVMAFIGGQKQEICPCGSGNISPRNVTGMDWLLPRVWKLALYVFLGRLAPPPVATRPVKVEPMVNPNAKA